MKEFKIEFIETVTYTTIVEAEDIDGAREAFMNGDFGDCEEIDRDYYELTGIDEV